jgi:ribonuclease-3
MKPSLGRLQKAIGYCFQDEGLLARALTHRSASGQHNERLEFLGDALLGAVVARRLYLQFPELDEGALSRLRSRIVKGTHLAVVARDLGLGDYLRLGEGELKSGGFRRESILADAMEALIGAVYCDGGQEAAEALIERLFGSRMAALRAEDARKDPKTELQERLQGRGLPTPDYEVLSTTGAEHNQLFEVECKVSAAGKDLVTVARGHSRKKAEQAAAQSMLELLDEGEWS